MGSEAWAASAACSAVHDVATYYAPPVQDVIDELSRLPGIGPKSAQRIAYHLLRVSKQEAARLSTAISDLKERVARGEVTVIDVRDDNAFRMGHIPGSLHIPFARVEGEAGSLPRGKPIVTVCT